MQDDTNATCPDCGTATYKIVNHTFDSQELIDALCDGCAADRAVASAYADTPY